MPERRHHHVLDGACLAIRELHLHLLLAPAWAFIALGTRSLLALARRFAAFSAWCWRVNDAHAWSLPTSGAGAWLLGWFWLPIPFRIAEVLMGFDEIVYGEIVLAIVKP